MDEKISRSEQKRRFKQIESAAKELADLSDSDLKRLPGSDQLKQELVATRGIKGGARNRQIKYAAKILKTEPVAEILKFLQQEKGSKLEENRFQQEAENFRDGIIDDALQAYNKCRQFQQPWELDWISESLDRVMKKFPGIDENELRSSAHQYARNRNKKHYRELIRIVRAAADKKRLSER